MCGIFGYLSQFDALPKSTVTAMGARISHRGPDDSGVFFAERCALGNQRLSIIDIQGGHQPFVSDDGNIVVVQNGEIYNHIELAQELRGQGVYCKTHSDTEVILRLYEHYGIDFVSRLNGMFAIAIYDKRIDGTYLIRDRVGIKPLYLYQYRGMSIFSSEIKGLLTAPINDEINLDAIDHYLTLNYVPPPMTIYKHICHVKPGSWVLLKRDSQVEKQWWSLKKEAAIVQSEPQWIEQFHQILDDAVRLRMRADVPFGAFLSGGVDSSTIVGKMSAFADQAVRTYNIGFHEKAYDESVFAEQAARRFKTIHKHQVATADIASQWPHFIYHADQPHGDVSFIPTYMVSAMASKDVKMVLTGDGADELFAGYDKYHRLFESLGNDYTEAHFQQRFISAITLFDEQSKAKLFAHNTNTQQAKAYIQELLRDTEQMDDINRVLYFDTVQLLPGNNLVKPDKMGMAASLEARVPFLDYRMVEYAFRMPGHLKLHQGEGKYLYKKAVKDLIGEDLAYRKKQMFTVPVGDWFRGSLSSLLASVLSRKSIERRGLFDFDYVEHMKDTHVSGQANYTRELRALVSLELWFQQFVDKSFKDEPAVAKAAEIVE